jgi:hypothetical protein
MKTNAGGREGAHVVPKTGNLQAFGQGLTWWCWLPGGAMPAPQRAAGFPGACQAHCMPIAARSTLACAQDAQVSK